MGIHHDKGERPEQVPEHAESGLAQTSASVQFDADYTEEVNGYTVGVKIGESGSNNNVVPDDSSNDVVPDESFPLTPCSETATTCDWKARGAVSPVVSQGGCGSCWAFAAAASAEANYYIKHGGNFLDLSEQQSVDCVTASNGCGGGHSNYAFDYHKTAGWVSEADYPYSGTQGTCQTASKTATANPIGHTVFNYESPDELKRALRQGTTTVYIWASDPVFMQYTSGVVTSDCTSNDINHAVTAVGYGVDAGTNTPYFLLKNSWGSNWGANGYIKVGQAPGNGVCGVTYWNPFRAEF